MEIDSVVSKSAADYCDKTFGDKELLLKQVMMMDMVLDKNDPVDEEKKQSFLTKIAKEHLKDKKLLTGRKFLIHDASGNLTIPYNC